MTMDCVQQSVVIVFVEKWNRCAIGGLPVGWRAFCPIHAETLNTTAVARSDGR